MAPLFDFTADCWKTVFAAADGRKSKLGISEINLTLRKVNKVHKDLKPDIPTESFPALSTYGNMIHGFALLLSAASGVLAKNVEFMYKMYTLGKKKAGGNREGKAVPLHDGQGDEDRIDCMRDDPMGALMSDADVEERMLKELHMLQATTGRVGLHQHSAEWAFSDSQRQPTWPTMRQDNSDMIDSGLPPEMELENLLAADDMDCDGNNMDTFRDSQTQLMGSCTMEAMEVEYDGKHGGALIDGDGSPLSIRYAEDLAQVGSEAVSASHGSDVPASADSVADSCEGALVQPKKGAKKYFDDAKQVRKSLKIKTTGVDLAHEEEKIKTLAFESYSLNRWSKVYEDAFSQDMDEDDEYLMNLKPFTKRAQRDYLAEWYVPRHEQDPLFVENPERYFESDEEDLLCPNSQGDPQGVVEVEKVPSIDGGDENVPDMDCAMPSMTAEDSDEDMGARDSAEAPQQEDRIRERKEWDLKFRHGGVFSHLCPIEESTKLTASRAFHHMLARATQGSISVRQAGPYEEISFCPLGGLDSPSFSETASRMSSTGYSTGFGND